MSNPLLHSPAHIVAVLLVAKGMGVTPPAIPWPIYATNEPDTPDEVITVFDTMGMGHGRSQIDGQQFYHYGIQVRVRSKTPNSGYPKIAAIGKTLDESIYAEVVIIDGTTYCVHAISRRGQALALGKETPTSKRNVFVINATVATRRV